MTFLTALCMLSQVPAQNVIREKLMLDSDGKQVFGQMHRPEGVKQAPLVIVSHGFNGSYVFGQPYAKELAPLGYAVYCFDFPGGSARSKSEGATTDMSVFSEKADLLRIIDQLSTLDYIDSEHITLIGESQGGMVSALVASELKDRIERLVLVYPALCIKDDWVKMYPDVNEGPDTLDFWGLKLSKTYYRDLYDLDVFKTITKYEGPVIIVHGDHDPVVNVSYSIQAQKEYRNARLEILPGEGHGFSRDGSKKSIAFIREFLTQSLETIPDDCGRNRPV